jgi:hypothetical protein
MFGSSVSPFFPGLSQYQLWAAIEKALALEQCPFNKNMSKGFLGGSAA